MSSNQNQQHEHKDHTRCAAYGCNLLGTHTSSTNGTSEWWCQHHFGKEATRLQEVTREINSREWLAYAITTIRTHYGTKEWEAGYRSIQQQIIMAQRKDMLRKNDESVGQWLHRLHSELDALCSGTTSADLKPVPQPELLPADGPQRLHLPVPEHV